MKNYILLVLLAFSAISASIAVNPIKEGNMISGHVIVKGTEENIPYATILIKETAQGTISNDVGQFEFKNLPTGKYTLKVSAVGYCKKKKVMIEVTSGKFTCFTFRSTIVVVRDKPNRK